jgi:hypothetical protein
MRRRRGDHVECAIVTSDGDVMRLLNDGRIDLDTADAIDTFREFLRCVGPPARDGESVQAGPLARLEHRPDLIRYALGVE